MADDHWLEDHLGLLSNHYISLMQVCVCVCVLRTILCYCASVHCVYMYVCGVCVCVCVCVLCLQVSWASCYISTCRWN